MDSADRKLARLRKRIDRLGSLAVAFSGGVDSTFLAAVGQDVLGDRCLAVTATSPTYPERELAESRRLARRIGVRQVVVDSNELRIPGFADNPPDRCFHCKRELFRVLREVARRHGIRHIADGTDADDVSDYRPGRRAAKAARVKSPLLEAGLGKAEIRVLSRRMGLPTASKPSYACLASRFPYGCRITAGRLRAVDALESEVRRLGVLQVRVRFHGPVARIEVEPGAILKLCRPAARARLVRAAQRAGFSYVAVDLEGYRTGSLNRELSQRKRSRAGQEG